MKNILTFKTKKVKNLFVQFFETDSPGLGDTVTFNLKPSENTEEKIYQKVLNLENQYRKEGDSSGRKVIFRYWVTEIETITDNRSEFGHENQSSSKNTGLIVLVTHVRGEIVTIAEVLALHFANKLPSDVKNDFSNFISKELEFDEKNLTKDNLQRIIVMIPGEGRRSTFFDQVIHEENVKIFPEDKLVPIK